MGSEVTQSVRLVWQALPTLSLLVSPVWTFSLSHCLMWPQTFLCLSLFLILAFGGWDSKPGLL